MAPWTQTDARGLVIVLGTLLAALFVAAWLYTRITGTNALEQQTRRRVFELVCESPGIRLGTIARRLGLEYTSARHHVRRLEKLGFVQGIGKGQRRYVSRRDLCCLPWSTRTKLLNPASRLVFEHLREVQRGSVSGIAEALSLEPSTISKAAQRLEALGLATSVRDGPRVLVEMPNGPQRPYPHSASVSCFVRERSMSSFAEMPRTMSS